MTAVTNQSINTLLAKGVRNIWYPICPSHFLGEKPISLRRLGLKVVLWRDEIGQAGHARGPLPASRRAAVAWASRWATASPAAITACRCAATAP